MEINSLQDVRAKRVELVVLGAPIAPSLAAEVLRRTDILFQHLTYLRLDAYGRAVRDRLGFPQQMDRRPGRYPSDAEHAAEREVAKAIARWRDRWGSIDLQWLFNNQALGGRGWCHTDGTIALADELEDYPSGEDLLADCRRLAAAFPDLKLDIAVWGSGESALGSPLTDAPRTAWPADMLAAVRRPTIGFLIGDGLVEVVPGDSSRLFQRSGTSVPQAMETALSEARRCQDAAERPSQHGDGRHGRGVPDEVIEIWRTKAQALGLCAPI